jgi:hypothetical protein
MSRGDGNILFDKKFVKAIAKKEKDPSETFPGEALSQRETEEVLYPIVWETTENINGIRRTAYFGGTGTKSAVCHDLAQHLAKENIGRQIKKHYADWEENALATGVYAIIASNKKITSRQELMRMWGRLFSAASKDSRILVLKKYLYNPSDEDVDKILQSLPAPRRLVVSGNKSIRKDPKNGTWGMESFPAN